MIVNRNAVTWTSASDGTASATVELNGTLLAVAFKADSGGTQPTDAYDLVVSDPDGIDILAGLGANLSNSTATIKCPMIAATDGTTTTAVPRPVSGTHTVAITNAGNAKGGRIAFYVR